MSIPATIADVPFLSTAPEWNSNPSWKRNWIGDIAASLVGQENRAAMRSRGLVTLGYRVTPYTTEDRAQVETIWRAALKAARIAVPYWTHAADLAADVATASSILTLNSSLYAFRVGDFVWLRNGEGDGQANRVTDVNEDGSLALLLPTEFALSASDLIWPIVFGIPNPGADNSVDSPARLNLDVAVTDIDVQAQLAIYLAPPMISEPAAGGTVSSYSPRISWLPVLDAAQYLVEIFNGAVCGGTAFYSHTLDLSAPAIVEPGSGGNASSYGARISWTKVSNCAGYRVEIFAGAVCGGAAIYSQEVAV